MLQQSLNILVNSELISWRLKLAGEKGDEQSCGGGKKAPLQ